MNGKEKCGKHVAVTEINNSLFQICKCTHVRTQALRLIAVTVIFDCMIETGDLKPSHLCLLSGKLSACKAQWICSGDRGSHVDEVWMMVCLHLLLLICPSKRWGVDIGSITETEKAQWITQNDACCCLWSGIFPADITNELFCDLDRLCMFYTTYSFFLFFSFSPKSNCSPFNLNSSFSPTDVFDILVNAHFCGGEFTEIERSKPLLLPAASMLSEAACKSLVRS